MKQGKNLIFAALLTVACILLDLAGKWAAGRLGLPLWLDCFGTVIAACVLGPVSGAAVGLAANVISGVFNHVSQIYGLTNIAIGLIVGFAARRKRFDTLFTTMGVCTLTALAAAVISTALNACFYGGMTGNKWGDGVILLLREEHVPPVLCWFLGQFYLDFLDKVLTLVLLFAGIHLRRRLRRRREGRTASGKAALALALVLLPGAAWVPSSARAAEYNRTDFYAYVQTVYNGENGLPSGEATDIAQTRDGLLWVGTYAGLYRYDGSSFTPMPFPSVKNVKCLYVDEEGRLWVGTNDKGLSMCIGQSVSNVLDMKSGLSSDSVRSIVRSADGYYYVGTTDATQVLSLEDGLQIVGDIPGVTYVPSLAADSLGNVAAVNAKGKLFLLREGQVVLSDALPTEAGIIYTCCMFDTAGLLYVGTSGNEARVFRVKGDELVPVTTYTFEGLQQINSLKRTEDGLLFACGDNGVGCFDAAQAYSLLNLPGFDNSIDRMTVDYQGNFWFTSSRYGLLRLSKGAFTDIYASAAMEKYVTNGVTLWQRKLLCIAGDKGLDLLDVSTGEQVKNELTARLAGVRLRCVFVDSRERLWICTHGKGLLEVDGDWNVKVYDASNGFCNWLRIVREAEDGTIVGSGDLGLGYFRDGELTGTVTYDDALGSAMILTLEEGKDGLELAGTNGNGLLLLRDRQVFRRLTAEDGLSSGVVLRTVYSQGAGGWYIVTSNGLCFMDEGYNVRILENFPYSNNYDLWARDGTLYVLGSAGVFVVNEAELLSGKPDLTYELLNARRGLSAALTPNSWNYLSDAGVLYLSTGGGVYSLNLKNYNAAQRSFRLQVSAVSMDGTATVPERGADILVGRDVMRLDLSPLVLNYSLEDPYVSYQLVGYEPERTVVRWSELGDVSYTGLPAGTYTFNLAVLDQNREPLEQRSYTVVKEREFRDNWWFNLYVLAVGGLMVAWITWFIARTQIQRTLNFQRKELEFARQQVQMGNETILAIAKTVDAKDVSTHQHSQRVSEYSVMIGRELGFSEKDCENLRKAALLHDIGKIGIPDRILNKPGKLTDEEYAVMKSHVTHGAEILKDFTMVEHVVEGALYHHERYDGKGYVSGLKGEEIPIYGRIIGVADTFDAMTQTRVYRQGLDVDFVLGELERCKGTQFDPRIADIMIRLVREGKITLPRKEAEQIS